MRFWVRELAGWLLILLGLFCFYWVIVLLSRPVPGFLQSGPIMVMGIFVFRGGIHLLKVAVAARIVLRETDMVRKPDTGRRR